MRPLLHRNDLGTGLVTGESDDGGFDEFRLFCPNCRRNWHNLGLKPLNPLGLPHYQSSELPIGRTAISKHPTMVNKMAARSTSHAGDLTSHAGRWVYLYRAIDQFGQVIDVLVSESGTWRPLAGSLLRLSITAATRAR